MPERWGKEGKYAFREALERGQIPAEEVRAVQLLATISDPERLEFYLTTGVFPARGNLTGLTYLIRKGGGAYEVSGVDLVANWCIAVDDGPVGRAAVPPTDHVTALRTLIEGEEQAFRREGNRSTVRHTNPPRPFFGRNVYGEPFCEADPKLVGIGLDTLVDFDSQLVDLERVSHGDLKDDPILNGESVLPDENPLQVNWGDFQPIQQYMGANTSAGATTFYAGANQYLYPVGQAQYNLAT